MPSRILADFIFKDLEEERNQRVHQGTLGPLVSTISVEETVPQSYRYIPEWKSWL